MAKENTSRIIAMGICSRSVEEGKARICIWSRRAQPSNLVDVALSVLRKNLGSIVFLKQEVPPETPGWSVRPERCHGCSLLNDASIHPFPEKLSGAVRRNS